MRSQRELLISHSRRGLHRGQRSLTAPIGRTYDRTVPVAPSFEKALASGAVPHMGVDRTVTPTGSHIDTFDRCCRKKNFWVEARNINSRSSTSAQHQFNMSVDRIRLLPAHEIPRTFSTASTQSGNGEAAYSITSSARVWIDVGMVKSSAFKSAGSSTPTLVATERWNDVPRGTMDEVSSYVRLDLLSARRQGRPKDCSASFSNPMMEGPWCPFRREVRARARHRQCSGGWSESA